jgi:DNA-binding transcriptional LysR family regulator
MDLKDLQAFTHVADLRGFRRAAEFLGIEQSAISRRVRRLEDQVGVSLFERGRGRVNLTCAGERLRNDLWRVFADLEIAIAQARAAGEGRTGIVRLGVGASLFGGHLRRLLTIWRMDHPDVALEIIEASPATHVAYVANQHIDVAIVAGSDWTGGCEVEVLWKEQVCVVLPSGRVSEFTTPVPIADLARHAIIVSRHGFGPQIRDWVLRRFSNLSSSPKVEFVDASRGVLFSMVGLGLGLTFATSAEAEVEYPNVAFLPVEGECLPYSALWLAENDNPALRRFLSLARLQLKNGSAAPSRTPDL